MSLTLDVHARPLVSWWAAAPELKEGGEVELPLPGNTALPLGKALLLLDGEDAPRALLVLREVRTNPDGSVVRGHVLRLYDAAERRVLAALLRTPVKTLHLIQ